MYLLRKYIDDANMVRIYIFIFYYSFQIIIYLLGKVRSRNKDRDFEGGNRLSEEDAWGSKWINENLVNCLLVLN